MAKKRFRRGVDAKGRSIGEVRHLRLRHYMLRSPAWRSIGPVARSLLVEVWQRHNGINNGEISLSVREAAANLGIHKDTVSKAFHELEDKGFLKARQRGSFTHKFRRATEWEITDEPFRDKPASKDFMHWKPTTEKQKTVLTSRTDGPNEQDRVTHDGPQNTSHGPNQQDRQPENGPPHGPTEQDTSIIPGGFRESGTSDKRNNTPVTELLAIPERFDRRPTRHRPTDA